MIKNALLSLKKNIGKTILLFVIIAAVIVGKFSKK